jgi:hypothetical protein
MVESGVWRDVETGVNPFWSDPEWADGATDQPGTPAEPIYTRFEGPWGVPWFDGLEDPGAVSGLFASPDPTYPDEAVGAEPRVGAYQGAFRTHGPVRQWSHEPSGGLTGDQAIGRIMRFPANIPDRYDPNGVWNLDYRDELAASIAANESPYITEAQITSNLIQWPNVSDY